MERNSIQLFAATVMTAALSAVCLAGPASASPTAIAAAASVIETEAEFAGNQSTLLADASAAHADADGKSAKEKSSTPTFSGNVSWYGSQFHGRRTASGRIFDMNKLTCAHRTLPFGTKILVENPRTGQSVIVEVIDRGPYAGHRIMDLSREAARRLGVLLGGLAFVECTVISKVAK